MKVYIKTFGCRVNQVESQSLLEEFLKRGDILVKDYQNADICLLNTCTVTHNADRDVERTIRQIIKNNPTAKLILTGCYALAHQDKIKENFPTAKAVSKINIANELFGSDIDWTVKEHQGHSRAFVKIQDGCDCFCSYCIVPFARPNKISKPKQIVLKEIQGLIDNGYKEIVLTGINIGNYNCPQTGENLAQIMPDIFALKGEFRIRFSSIELNTLTDDLLAVIQNPKFCNYLHLPLQSGSDKVLKNMRRHYTTQEYFDRVQKIRSLFPNIGLFCDIIAGYPTETQEDFEITQEFLKKVNFAGMHIFSYSSRKGTVASTLPQLAPNIIKQRADILRILDNTFRQNFAKMQIGKTDKALLEDFCDNTITGVLGNFQRVKIDSNQKQKGLIVVKIISAKDGLCIGQII